MRAWAERLACDVVDAPVSGGVARAGDGDLLIMVGGAEAAVERARPLLDALARSAPHVGPEPGDGQKVKLVNQLLCGVHIAAAAEGLAFAEALGLDARACWEVLRDGAAASFMLDDRGARMVDGAFDEVKSALDIFVKDMGLVTEAARERDYAAPMAAAAQQLYAAGHEAGLGRLDDSALIKAPAGRMTSRPKRSIAPSVARATARSGGAGGSRCGRRRCAAPSWRPSRGSRSPSPIRKRSGATRSNVKSSREWISSTHGSNSRR